MATAVYLMCALTSFICALLLGRAYIKAKLRLLLWSCCCFVALAINNLLLFIDLIVVPEVDLTMWRGLSGLVGVGMLVYGLVWDAS